MIGEPMPGLEIERWHVRMEDTRLVNYLPRARALYSADLIFCWTKGGR